VMLWLERKGGEKLKKESGSGRWLMPWVLNPPTGEILTKESEGGLGRSVLRKGESVSDFPGVNGKRPKLASRELGIGRQKKGSGFQLSKRAQGNCCKRTKRCQGRCSTWGRNRDDSPVLFYPFPGGRGSLSEKSGKWTNEKS